MHITAGRNIKLWGDDVTYYNMEKLRDKIEELQDKDPRAWITLEISSGGGDCLPGYSLYDWIMAHQVKLQTVAYGHVQSMAVVLYLAGEHRVVTPNSFFFLHQVARTYKGQESLNIEQHIQAVSQLREFQTRYLRIFRNRVPDSPHGKELDAIFAATKTLSPKQAKKWGLVHEILK